jgi:hypothetical protein
MLLNHLYMIRKVGVFYPKRGPMGVATACLLAMLFLLLHAVYQPFKSATCNVLQGLCLAVLVILYFCGLLLKANTMNSGEAESVGNLLICLLVSTLVAVGAMVLKQARTARQMLKFLQHSFKILFKGKILCAEGVDCVTSFPGKYENGWNAVVHAGKVELMSVACVFLPQGTQHFGAHYPNPETPAKCFCHALYGEKKQWGCKWFKVWADLADEAVARHQRLVVYYSPGEVGEGEVPWSELAAHSVLRDEVMKGVPKKSDGWPKKLTAKENEEYLAGLTPRHRHCMVGLGGSQKGEVAWLEKRRQETGCAGYAFDRVDVRELIVNQGVRPMAAPALMERLDLAWTPTLARSLAELRADTLEAMLTAAARDGDYSAMEEAIRAAAGSSSSAAGHAPGSRRSTPWKVSTAALR